MDSYHIRGGHRIEGECTVRGAKNAALPILAAAIVTGSEVELENCPEISDVENMLEILRALGCRAERKKGALFVDAGKVDCCVIPARLMKGMRSSVFLMGPLLARCGEVILSQPGGCEIGARPIDIHISALKQLGATIEEKAGLLVCRSRKLSPADITLEFPSVGATENAMLAALAAEGETIIRNGAREPEIIDLQDFLVKCGAKISGAGTDQIVVSGQRFPSRRMHSAQHKIMPDRIEAGTLLAAAAITGGRIDLRDAKAGDMEAVLEKFREAGCRIVTYAEGISLQSPERLSSASTVTMPYPGFPTDMQSQFLTMMTVAEGESLVTETIFENRFKQAYWLSRMGAKIQVTGRSATIRGVEGLTGCRTVAEDLRGGAALVLAGLAAEGETIVEGAAHIERGYDRLEQKLSCLGAVIEKQA